MISIIKRITALFLCMLLCFYEKIVSSIINRKMENCQDSPKITLRNEEIFDIKGLKVDLKSHQKQALGWMLRREESQPSGGILADDMGLGKTLTTIAFLIKSKELLADQNQKTLIICPASLIEQWSKEIENKVEKGKLNFCIHHGNKRATEKERLAGYDVVISTYGLVLSEFKTKGPLFGNFWRRIVLDEAHQIRNYKSKISEAIFQLGSQSKWVLTGTPIQNEKKDLFSYFKFLRFCDDSEQWTKTFDGDSSNSENCLNTVLSCLMLRRTKEELMAKRELQGLPVKYNQIIGIELNQKEMDYYQSVYRGSRKLCEEYLKRELLILMWKNYQLLKKIPSLVRGLFLAPQNSYIQLFKYFSVDDSKQNVTKSNIFVRLLRLRQICCHPELAEDPNLQQYCKSPDILRSEYMSTKMQKVAEILDSLHPTDKIIIVSQWKKFLDLIASYLNEKSMKYVSFDGSTPIVERQTIVETFNNQKNTTKIMLLSLKAGGVGLNLIGANHLLLIDLHWNPQLEKQAEDRIYRMGQKKTVFIYKILSRNTIEERVQELQKKKLETADKIFEGSKKANPNNLTLAEMQFLFDLPEL